MVERNKTFQIVTNIIMILLCLFCVLPLWLLIASSMTNEQVLIKNGYSLIPREIDLSAYKYILVDSTQLLRGYIISICVTVIGTLANLTLTDIICLSAFPEGSAGKKVDCLLSVFYYAV